MTRIDAQFAGPMMEQLRPWFHPLDRSVALGENEIVSKWHAMRTVISAYARIPGIVGFWPMISDRFTGNVYDLSWQNRTLTYNGNPQYGIQNDVITYIDLDGTGDYLSRVTENALDITGAESQVESDAQGWFYTCWFNGTSVASGQLTSKGNAIANQSAWECFISGAGVTSRISKVGAGAYSTITYSITLQTGTWYFYAAQFKPSTYLRTWVNGDYAEETLGIPVSITVSALDFLIGQRSTFTNLFNGKLALCALGFNNVPDDYILYLYKLTREMFGV